MNMLKISLFVLVSAGIMPAAMHAAAYPGSLVRADSDAMYDMASSQAVSESESRKRTASQADLTDEELISCEAQAIGLKRQKNSAHALCEACADGDLSALINLIEEGVSLDGVNHRGETALILAAKNGHEKVVRTLLALGANPRLGEIGSWDSFIQAAQNNVYAIVNFFTERHLAELNQADVSHRITLQDTVMHGYDDIIKCLAAQNNTDGLKLLAQWTKAMIATVKMPVPHKEEEIFFSPVDKLRHKLLALIEQETKSILVGMYTFTDPIIADELIRASRFRGVKVEIVVDKYSLEVGQANIEKLSECFPVYVYVAENETPHSLMHHKFAVFARNEGGIPAVWNGSFNFTDKAHCINRESAVVMRGASAARTFTAEFARIKAQSQCYRLS